MYVIEYSNGNSSFRIMHSTALSHDSIAYINIKNEPNMIPLSYKDISQLPNTWSWTNEVR